MPSPSSFSPPILPRPLPRIPPLPPRPLIPPLPRPLWFFIRPLRPAQTKLCHNVIVNIKLTCKEMILSYAFCKTERRMCVPLPRWLPGPPPPPSLALRYWLSSLVKSS